MKRPDWKYIRTDERQHSCIWVIPFPAEHFHLTPLVH
jgi:hypothetical protein